jgi:hypothetical protein
MRRCRGPLWRCHGPILAGACRDHGTPCRKLCEGRDDPRPAVERATSATAQCAGNGLTASRRRATTKSSRSGG